MRGYLLDVKARKARTVEVSDTDRRADYQKLLDCNLVNIVSRQLEGTYFDVICDDEALFTADPIVSAFDSTGEPALVGNLPFCNYDGQGGETSLSDDDIELLRRHTRLAIKPGAEDTDVNFLVVMTDLDP